MHGLARVGEPKAEQRAGYELAAQADGDVAEVNLGLAAREVLLRDERVGRFPSDLDANLAASGGDVLADHPVRHHPGPVMFVKQSIEDPLRRVSLLPRRVEVRSAASRRSPLGTRQAVSRVWAVAFSPSAMQIPAPLSRFGSRRRACAAARGWTSQIGHPSDRRVQVDPGTRLRHRWHS